MSRKVGKPDELRRQKRLKIIARIQESGEKYPTEAIVAALEAEGVGLDFNEMRLADARHAVKEYRQSVSHNFDFSQDLLNLYELVLDPATHKMKKVHYYKSYATTTLDEDRRYRQTLIKEARTGVHKLERFCEQCIEKHGARRQRYFKFDSDSLLRDPLES